MNCSRRLEYPLDMLIIAKAAYPERFKDINVYDFALDLYKKAYHVDDETARGLRRTQILDWMSDMDF
jgi:iron complex transport system substrate-binding protein